MIVESGPRPGRSGPEPTAPGCGEEHDGRSVLHLLVVGQGFEEHPAFRTAANEEPRLRLCGRVYDVPRYLAAADVFLFPSRGEGLSNAMLEALAHGLPCVASRIPANAELLAEGAGLLAPPKACNCPVGGRRCYEWGHTPSERRLRAGA